MFKGISPIILIIPAFIIQSDQPSPVCGRAEYHSGSECCPVCSAGYHVRKHCTEYTSTTCAPCPPSTYSDQPNGLRSCLSCTVCDHNAGLRQRRGCSTTSDTLCEPLEGYYCTDPIKDGCQGAVEHTKCSPGQYISQNGTTLSDTLCADCGNHTYSDGSFISCKPHTRCEALEMDVIQKGTSSSDTECGKRGLSTAAVIIIVLVILAAVAACIGIILYHNRSRFQLVTASEDEDEKL